MIELEIRKEGKNWLFDDDRFAIVKELFVGGTSELIDLVVAKKGLEGKTSLTLSASRMEFPKCFSTRLDSFNSDTRWSTYHHEEFGFHRLCPVLLVYFSQSPKILYFDVN